MKLNIEEIRKEFPFLDEKEIDKVGKKVIYFDSAATSQKPLKVIESVADYYKYSNSNPGRSAHFLGSKASNILEESRKVVSDYINSDANEIVFTRSATDGINLVASTWGKYNLNPGDEIITTIIEHNSNYIPWRELANENDIKINIIDVDESYNLKTNKIYEFLNENTKLITITAASNVTGEIINLKEIIAKVKEYNKDIKIIVDATQFVSFDKIDVKDINCDFLVFSGHKLYAPMGVGVLFGKKELLENMKPYQFGGGMVEYLNADSANYKEIPNKFEAGTLNVGSIVGLKTAIEWLNYIGIDDIQEYEKNLIEYALEKIIELENIRIIRSNNSAVPLISFMFSDIHAHDVTSILDSFGIATRSGHHCAMLVHNYLNIPATVRISLSVFNTKEEIDFFIDKLKEVRKIMVK